MEKQKILKIKKRPPRVYVTKTGRYYIMKNNKKVYIQIPKSDKPISQKQIQKQIVNVVLSHPKYHVPMKRRKRTFSKTGKIYFQKPFIKGLVGSKFGFTNTQKSLIGKEIMPGIYEPHTLPNYVPRPTFSETGVPIKSKAEIAIQNTPLSIDQETQVSNTEDFKKLVNKGIIALQEAQKQPKKKGYTSMTTLERNAYYKKLESIYPDYIEFFKEAQLLGKVASIKLIKQTNLPIDRLVQNIDEFLPLFKNYPHELRDQVITSLYKTRLQPRKEAVVPPVPVEKEAIVPYNENKKLQEDLEKNERMLAVAKGILPLEKSKQMIELLTEEQKFLKGLSKDEREKYKVLKEEGHNFPEEIRDRLEEFGYYDRLDYLTEKYKTLGFSGKKLEKILKKVIEDDKKLKDIISEVKEIEQNELINNTMIAYDEGFADENLTEEESPDVSYISRGEIIDDDNKEGSGKFSNWKKGLYDIDIHRIMEHKAKRFVPVIMSDEIPTLLPYVNGKTKEFGFIINSTSSKTNGQHWRAVFIDIPSSEIDYYDSLVSQPTKEFLTDIKLLIDKINPSTYMKLKINMIKQQKDDTENCGFFACKFIIDRFKNKSFKNCTGSDKSDMGEFQIEKFKNYL